MPLLEIKQLRVAFSAQSPEVVQGISLSIAPGARVAIVGESGSGKSVTSRAILRLDTQASYAGEIIFDGQNVFSASNTALKQLRGGRIAMIFQEPMSAFNPLYTIGNQITEVLRLHRGMNRAQAKTEMLALLLRVGISDAQLKANAYPFQLSGGQRQRAMIAMALAGQPELLIADEPTTALDVTLQAQIMALLLELQRERNMALLLITHDLALVKNSADHVYVMQNGLIVESAPSAQLFAQPAHPYTQQLLNSRSTRFAKPMPESAADVLQVRGLSQQYRQAGFWRDRYFTALAPLDLHLRAGETLAVVGESGSGKTSLAMALLRLTQGGKGEISCQGIRFDTLRGGVLRAARRHMQIVFQDPFAALSQRLTVADIVAEGLMVHEPTLSPAECREKVVQILQQVGLDEMVMTRYPHEFSGGQRQRIAIARALILNPRVLVLDEPSSALDATVQQQVLALLARLQQELGLAYVLITHDLNVVKQMAHRVMVLQAGVVQESGTVDAVLHAPQHPYTQGLIAASCI